MNTADNTSDLLAQIALLKAQNEAISSQLIKLEHTNKKLTFQISSLEKKNEEYLKEIQRLIELHKMANMRYFKSKSEKFDSVQLSFFNEFDLGVDFHHPEPKPEELVVIEDKPSKKRKTKRVVNWSKYETEVIEHKLDEDKQSCPACASVLTEMGYDVKRVLKYIPAKTVVEEHRVYNYVCKNCSKQNELDGGITPVYITQAPCEAITPLSGTCAHASLIASLIYQKYALGLPLYRIAADLKHSAGLDISRQTMAGWVIKTYERWIALIYTLMKEKLLERDVIQADESSVQVLKEKDKSPQSKSYMWLFCSNTDGVPIYIYQYDKSRSREVAVRFLSGWSGYLVADGYAAYDNLGDTIVRSSCLVHIRRKFTDIVKSLSKTEEINAYNTTTRKAINLINELFHIDNQFNDMTPEARKEKRLELLKPKMDSFIKWCSIEHLKATPGMALHTALGYTLKQWPKFENVLLDGRIPLENNESERALKPFCIGRKAWLFCDTTKGAEASAAYYSLSHTARQNGLKIFEYFSWILSEMPKTKDISNTEVLERFLPWSDKIPEWCYMTPEDSAKPDPMDEAIMDIDPKTIDRLEALIDKRSE